MDDPVPSTPEPMPVPGADRSATSRRLDGVLAGLTGLMASALGNELDQDRARRLLDDLYERIDQLPEDAQAYFRPLAAIQEQYILGLFERRAGRPHEALEHLDAALAGAQRLRDEVEASDAPWLAETRLILPNVELVLRHSAATERLKVASEDEAPKLQLEVADLQRRLSDVQGAGILFTVARQLQAALPTYGEGLRLLGELDLHAASLSLARARELAGDPERAIEEALAEAPDEMGPITQVLEELSRFYVGFEKLIHATELYTEAHRDAVLGLARPQHVDRLSTAADLLDEGLPELQAGLLVVARTTGRGDPADLEGSRAMFETQRKRVVNLRQLIQSALVPRQRARIAWPLVVPLFVITFVLSALGLRLSGLVDQLDGADLAVIAGLAAVIAFAGAFGPTVGLSALSRIGSLFGARDAPGGTADHAEP